VRAGLFADEQVRAVSDALVISEKAAALALVQATGIERQAVVDAYARHAITCLERALTWDQGEFVFEPGREIEVGWITVALELSALVAHLRARLERRRLVDTEIPDLNFLVRFIQPPEQPTSSVTLNPEEWMLVTQIGNGAHLHELAYRLGIGDYAVRDAVYRLGTDGLIEVRKSTAPPLQRVDAAPPGDHAMNGIAGQLAPSEEAPAGEAPPRLTSILPRLFADKSRRAASGD
jgi:hypothetical protein